ncbi:multidrug efflux system membrane fusion protein [Nitrobacteraceae bacterium AZCC 2146]
MLETQRFASPHEGRPEVDRFGATGPAYGPETVQSAGVARRNGYRVSAAVAGLVAAAAGVLAYGMMKTPNRAAAAIPAPVVTVALPLRKEVTKRAEFTGQFSAVNQVGLRAQVNGYLTEIHFQDGQLVKKGDLLFVIDPRPYQIQLQQATAQRETAAAGLDLAEKQVSRTARLNKEQFATDDLLDQRAQIQRTAAAAVLTADAAIRAAQLNLEFTRIVAPFSGRTSKRRVSVGSLVGGGADSTGATDLTSVISLDPIYLDFDMSEADYVAYKHSIAAQPAAMKTTVQVSLDGEKPLSRTGTLDYLDNQVDRGSGTMHVRATLSNPEMIIAPGQFARVRVPVSPPRLELLIPDAALLADQSTRSVMVVEEDGKVVPKQVEIGALDDPGMRVITRGLLPTDRVVVNGLMRLRPGTQVAAHLEMLPSTGKD